MTGASSGIQTPQRRRFAGAIPLLVFIALTVVVPPITGLHQ
jgi:hypothetical protein